MSQSAAKLVEAVEQVGGHLVSEGGRLKVSAPKPLPANLLEDLRHNKAALISYLNVPDEPLAEWKAAAAQLQQMECPWNVAPERWLQVLADTTRLLDWVPMLASLDWTVADVFGRDDLNRQSLAWKVQGQRIGPITKIAAVLRGTDGFTTWVYRRDSADSSDSAFIGSDAGSATSAACDAPSQGWDPETAALIKWFLGTKPPTHPFRLQRAVTIARPDKYWDYLKGDIAAGPTRARGKTGAFQENLRQLYRVLHDGKDIGGGTT